MAAPQATAARAQQGGGVFSWAEVVHTIPPTGGAYESEGDSPLLNNVRANYHGRYPQPRVVRITITVRWT